MAGLYIHIPFCKSRCVYCGFFSTTLHELQGRYVDAMLSELQIRKDYLKGENIETIYLGGGTPSQLKPYLLNRLLSEVIHASNCDRKTTEITVECNPDDINFEFASLLVNTGVNRVSMGVQTFSDKRLQFLHRRHTSVQIKNAVDILRKAGIKNISIDLMFGFPDETLEEWIYDIEKAISLNVEHISAYSLMYEEGTPLYRMLERGEINEISDELSRKMYFTLIDLLSKAGYEQYEISNFAKKSFISRHNSSYWKDIPYLGLGAGAHSYNHISRQWNIENIEEYINKINCGIVPAEIESIDETTHYNDIITTALRTRSGIDLNSADISSKYKEYLITQAKPLIKRGLLAVTDNRLHLTKKSLYISDDVMSDLIYLP